MKMTKALIGFLSILFLLSTYRGEAGVPPGTGVMIPSLSDDFEDPNWGFDYDANISSNGLWRGSFRGAPEVLDRIASPSGGVSPYSLRTRTAEDFDSAPWSTNNPAGQDDLCSVTHSTREIGRLLTVADYPSLVARVYAPDSSDWYTWGLRAHVDLPEGVTIWNYTFYYSSIWFKTSGANGIIQIRNSQAANIDVKNVGNVGPQWHTIGISWDNTGAHFYHKLGVGDLTEGDNIYDDWEPCTRLKYYWITTYTSVQGTLSPDYIIDNCFVHAAGMAEMTSPADEAADVSLSPTLSWTAGYSATSHKVYVGTSSSLGAGDLKATQSGATYSPTGLDYETTYYWRIDEVNPIGVSTGMTYSFTTLPEPLVTNTLPYAESFESYEPGEKLWGLEGWQAASKTLAPAVSTNAEALYALTNDYSGTFPMATNHTKVLWFSTEDQPVTNVVVSTTEPMVKTEMMIQPELWNVEEPPVVVDTDAQAGLYVDIDGKLNILHAATSDKASYSNTWHTLTGGPTITEDEWIRLAVIKDYSTKRFQIQVNEGEAIADADGWNTAGTAQPGSWFYMVNRSKSNLSSVEFENHAYLDDLVVSAYTAPGAPGLASNPAPANGAVDVSLATDLSWTAGGDATSHDVYFGTSSPGSYQGNQSGTTFDPGNLTTNETYYWRIDEINASGTTTGTVWSFTTSLVPPLPDVASEPSPADSASDVALTADLSWTAGEWVATHKVYFGESSPGTLQTNQTGTLFDPGILETNTTYYWRIDEVNAAGTTTGAVWNFTTVPVPPVPGAASNPSPSDTAEDVALTADLSWIAGDWAETHTVYFGTTSPGDLQTNQTGTTYDPGVLTTNTTYYWRIDEVNAGGTTTGTVWSFTTVPPVPGPASNPWPADEAADVTVAADLSWTAGSDAESHTVYFGATSPLDAGDSKGNQPGTSYDPGALEMETTYYWRIDEVNAGGTTTGTEWSFTTAGPPLITNTLPYAESFETQTVGHVMYESVGWLVPDGATATVSTNVAALYALTNDYSGTFPLVTNHTQVLEIVAEGQTITNVVVSTTEQMVKTEMMLRPNRWTVDDAVAVDADAQGGLYVGSGGLLSIMHAETSDGNTFNNAWHTLSAGPTVAEGEWIRLAIIQDYHTMRYQVTVNGNVISDADGWNYYGTAQPGTWFYMVNRSTDHLSGIEFTNNAFVDDMTVQETTVAPPISVGSRFIIR